MILAGGSGTRLWPLTRAARPKQFIPLHRGKSLFTLTLERISPVVGLNNILVVASAAHRGWIRSQASGLPSRNVILEETGRNTAASVVLAALWLRARRRDGVMVVLPSDHWIVPASAFRAAIRRAVDVIRRHRRLLALGVPARSAETGFGYIRPSGRIVEAGVEEVGEFVEKPGAGRAARIVRSHHVLWNSGMFVWRATDLLREAARHAPRVVRPLVSWARGAPGRAWRVPTAVMRRSAAQSIDRAVLERSARVVVVRGAFRWSDVGTLPALADFLRERRPGGRSPGRVLTLDAPRCFAISDVGLSVFVGVTDLMLVRAGDVILVGHRRATQRVRDVAVLLNGSLRRFA